MTRLIVIFMSTVFIVLVFLGILFLKDSYQILPVAASNTGEPTQFSSWRDFKAPDGKFSVMMPSFPQNAKQSMKDPKTKQPRQYDMYVAEKDNGTIFMISLITFVNNTETPELLQKSVVNDLLAANPTNQLKTMKVGDYKGMKTMDFSIENATMTIEGMTFSKGETLYLLSAIFPNATYNPEEFRYFVNSFDLR